MEGGMSAKILPDFDSEVRKVLACFDPSLADLNKEATARKDLQDTKRTLKKKGKKNVMPRVECASGVVYHGPKRERERTKMEKSKTNCELLGGPGEEVWGWGVQGRVPGRGVREGAGSGRRGPGEVGLGRGVPGRERGSDVKEIFD